MRIYYEDVPPQEFGGAEEIILGDVNRGYIETLESGG